MALASQVAGQGFRFTLAPLPNPLVQSWQALSLPLSYAAPQLPNVHSIPQNDVPDAKAAVWRTVHRIAALRGSRRVGSFRRCHRCLYCMEPDSVLCSRLHGLSQ